MATSPLWKVYNKEGKYVGSLEHPMYAAAVIVILGEGSTIRYDHRLIVWREGQEKQLADESYDYVAEKCYERRDAYLKQRNKSW